MNHQVSKTAFNPQLQINCSTDMNSYEITKMESIRKYEENLYLLGNIFSLEDKDKTLNVSITSANNTTNNNTFLKNKREANEDIFNLFENNEDNEDADDNDPDYKFQVLLRELNMKYKKNENAKIKPLLENLNTTYTEYKNEEKFLQASKSQFKEKNKNFEDLMNRMKSSKKIEEDNFFEDIINQADKLGIVTKAFKQDHYFINKNNNNLDKEKPFGPNDKVTLLPL